MSSIIGIDLGTSTTEAAVYKDGKPCLILNFMNEVVTPSAVGIDDSGNWVIGEKARAQYLLAPENTAIEIKRGIGTGQTFRIGKKDYDAVELSARLLEYVKTYASEYLGEDVSRAVISVPAYFNDIQRQQTIRAGRQAGFQVERILNEPTAAALSYGLSHMEEESHILVYDLGGGTFDVTLLEMFDGILEVKASNGDNQLGGKDFDEKLISYLLGEFRKKHRIDLAQDKYAMVRLKKEAENCKKALSEEKAFRVLIPMIAKKDGEPLAMDITVSREQFEEMTRELLERTHKPITIVLGDSGITPEKIDQVILVGGSTRMPMVAEDIEKFLHIPVSRAVNPDLAVAEGAAIQAAIMSGEIAQEEGLIMTDVNPYTLGVRASDDYSTENMSVIIPRNVTIPVSREEVYTTHSDYQTDACVQVFQGEGAYVYENHYLGEFMIREIPSAKAGKERIRVKFSYDLNGMLQVTATVVSTSRQASIDIDLTKAEGPAEPETEVTDVSGWKDAPGAAKYRAVIRRAERQLKKLEADSRKNADAKEIRETLEAAVDFLKKAILTENQEIADKCEKALAETLRMMEDLL